MILEPLVGLSSPARRREYDGSSVEISPGVVRWIPPSRLGSTGAFEAGVGPEARRPAAVTRVRTSFQLLRGGGVNVDQYVVTDADGEVLGSFPSGDPNGEWSAPPERQDGFYPEHRVRPAVEAAGLAWSKVDFTGDPRGLNARFPGQVPHLRLMTTLAWAQSVTVIFFGLFLAALPWLVGVPLGSAAFMSAFALYFLILGVYGLPPLERRRSARARLRADA